MVRMGWVENAEVLQPVRWGPLAWTLYQKTQDRARMELERKDALSDLRYALLVDADNYDVRSFFHAVFGTDIETCITVPGDELRAQAAVRARARQEAGIDVLPKFEMNLLLEDEYVGYICTSSENEEDARSTFSDFTDAEGEGEDEDEDDGELADDEQDTNEEEEEATQEKEKQEQADEEEAIFCAETTAAEMAPTLYYRMANAQKEKQEQIEKHRFRLRQPKAVPTTSMRSIPAALVNPEAARSFDAAHRRDRAKNKIYRRIMGASKFYSLRWAVQQERVQQLTDAVSIPAPDAARWGYIPPNPFVVITHNSSTDLFEMWRVFETEEEKEARIARIGDDVGDDDYDAKRPGSLRASDGGDTTFDRSRFSWEKQKDAAKAEAKLEAEEAEAGDDADNENANTDADRLGLLAYSEEELQARYEAVRQPEVRGRGTSNRPTISLSRPHDPSALALNDEFHWPWPSSSQ